MLGETFIEQTTYTSKFPPLPSGCCCQVSQPGSVWIHLSYYITQSRDGSGAVEQLNGRTCIHKAAASALPKNNVSNCPLGMGSVMSCVIHWALSGRVLIFTHEMDVREQAN